MKQCRLPGMVWFAAWDFIRVLAEELLVALQELAREVHETGIAIVVGRDRERERIVMEMKKLEEEEKQELMEKMEEEKRQWLSQLEQSRQFTERLQQEKSALMSTLHSTEQELTMRLNASERIVQQLQQELLDVNRERDALSLNIGHLQTLIDDVRAEGVEQVERAMREREIDHHEQVRATARDQRACR